ARRDGSISRPCYWSVPPLRLARTSTTPGAASGCPDTSQRSWAPHTGCPRPTVAPPLGAAGSCRTETSSVAGGPRVPDATTQTSGAPAPARRHRSPRSALHGCASLQNLAVSAPSTADATVPDTSCTHYSDPSPGCLRNAPPTVHGPPGPPGTAAPQTPSPNSSPPPITTRACPLDATRSRRGGPLPARAHTWGLPPLARRPPQSWPAPMGRSSPRSSAHQIPPPSSVASCASTSDTPPYTARPSLARGDRTSRWGRLQARARAWSHRTTGTPADAIDTRSRPVCTAVSRSLDAETVSDRRPIRARGTRYTARV